IGGRRIRTIVSDDREPVFPIEARMSRFFALRRVPSPRQRVFPFLERSRYRVRWFKRTILIATVLVISGSLAAAPRGRYLVVSLAERSRQLARTAIGVPPDRADVDAEWARYRRQNVESTLKEFRTVYAEMDPPLQRLMRYAGSDPENGLLRWGNLTQ